MFIKEFKRKVILVTGHTGFKGSWLSLWLLKMGAHVIGISKDIPTKPSHFQLLNLKKNITNYYIDLNNHKKIKAIIRKHKPHFIFHLAAQSLVKKSYLNPKMTWESNTLGTLNLLDSLRKINHKIYAVFITSDKSYKNLELKRGYKETDLLGGYDPYSASKAGAELAIQSYINSFFNKKKNKVFISIARAGNVIGGGDWAENRLVPDCFRNWTKNKFAIIRNPDATRPWQHVLEALNGYLTLACKLSSNPKKFHGQVFNFGPSQSQNKTVLDVLNEIKKNYFNAKWIVKKNKQFFESRLLSLNSNKAKKILKWKSKLSFKKNIQLVSQWYQKYNSKNNKKILHLSIKQIEIYEKLK